jgi:hypothetical protein
MALEMLMQLNSIPPLGGGGGGGEDRTGSEPRAKKRTLSDRDNDSGVDTSSSSSSDSDSDTDSDSEDDEEEKQWLTPGTAAKIKPIESLLPADDPARKVADDMLAKVRKRQAEDQGKYNYLGYTAGYRVIRYGEDVKIAVAAGRAAKAALKKQGATSREAIAAGHRARYTMLWYLREENRKHETPPPATKAEEKMDTNAPTVDTQPVLEEELAEERFLTPAERRRRNLRERDNDDEVLSEGFEMDTDMSTGKDVPVRKFYTDKEQEGMKQGDRMEE